MGHREMRLDTESLTAEPAANPERLSQAMAKLPRINAGVRPLQGASVFELLGLALRALAIWIFWVVVGGVVALLAAMLGVKLHVPVPPAVQRVRIGLAAASIGIPLGLLVSWIAMLLR